ncbi:PLAC8-domain-containing protein [Marasmius fiardii PR-910]|nr:PLAC8-domain-containing protein [Marasmius fiardii PR-910]
MQQKHAANSATVIVQQPSYTPQMIIQGGNRNSRNKPIGKDGKREWSVGLCGCGDEGGCGTCFLAWCCPCIVYGRNKKRFAALQSGKKPESVGCCNGDCLLHCCLSASTRPDIRARYNIRGGCCSDCFAVICCTPCELAQEHVELQLEEKSMGTF